MAWTISGQYMESCNCDYLCPCIYTNPQGQTTHDHCTALLVFRIDEGRADDTPLDDCRFALVIRSGRVMADGNWVFGSVVDAGTDAQRAALARITSGESGGTPQLIRDNLVSDFRGVTYQSIAISLDGLKRSVSIPGVLEFDIEGVASRNRSGEPFYMDNTAHPANRRLALARSTKTRVTGFGLALDMAGKGNNGHFAPFSWNG